MIRVLTYLPGSVWPIIQKIPEPEAPIAITAINCLGVTLWAISDPGATIPNRLIDDKITDGRVINGKFSLCHKGFKSLSYEFAQRIRDEMDWPMAQYMAYDGGFACVRQ